jgi:hypothetical protein
MVRFQTTTVRFQTTTVRFQTTTVRFQTTTVRFQTTTVRLVVDEDRALNSAAVALAPEPRFVGETSLDVVPPHGLNR